MLHISYYQNSIINFISSKLNNYIDMLILFIRLIISWNIEFNIFSGKIEMWIE